MADQPVIVSFGGGLNSSAMLIGLLDRGVVPDLILFADTGGERPETYAHVEAFSNWLRLQGAPAIVTVRGKCTLESDCLARSSWPSLAYGFRTCSSRFKHQPAAKYVNSWDPARSAWKRGVKLIRAFGFDFSEPHRLRGKLVGDVPENGDPLGPIYSFRSDPKYLSVYPLAWWGWNRSRCEQAFREKGLCVPTKSACFFCPASKRSEILSLPPDLRERALAIEDAGLAKVRSPDKRGLSGSWSWRALIEGDAQQQKLWDEPDPLPCDCWDGS